jgi:hypothetical protein
MTSDSRIQLAANNQAASNKTANGKPTAQLSAMNSDSRIQLAANNETSSDDTTKQQTNCSTQCDEFRFSYSVSSQQQQHSKQQNTKTANQLLNSMR